MQRRVDLRLVQPMAELVEGGEERHPEVVVVVAGGDADVARGYRHREGVRGRVQAPGVGAEPDDLEDLEDRAALLVRRVVAGEHPAVARLLGVAGGGDERRQRLAECGEQRAQLRRGELGLVVVEQRVVGVREPLEARDVAVLELDVARERVAEAAEVGRRARLEPRLLPERGGVGQLHGEVGRHAGGLLVVAAHPVQEADVLGLGVLPRRPGRERVEQPPHLGIREPLVEDALERPGLIGASGRRAMGHHRVLVPEQQRADGAEVGQLGHPLPQRDELGGSGGHAWRLLGVAVRQVRDPVLAPDHEAVAFEP